METPVFFYMYDDPEGLVNAQLFTLAINQDVN